jgi:hypothetical protein
LQTAGSLALRSYTASSYTGTLPVTYYWDDLEASGSEPKPASVSGPIKTVFVVMMENTSWSNIAGNTSEAPYLNSLISGANDAQTSYATQYYTPPGNHPSEPNYLWLDGGQCFTYCGIDSPPAASPSGIPATTPPNALHDLLTNAGISWTEYAEGITDGTCPMSDSYPYDTRHNPFVYFNDVNGSSSCTTHEKSFGDLAGDLAGNTVARYNFITPNVCDDMHSACSPLNDPIKQGDSWLQNNLPTILAAPAYKNGGAVLIIWDEGTSSSDGPIGMLALSPLAKGHGYANAIHYTHSSTLRTMEEIYGVSPFLGDAANATDLADLFVAGAIPTPTAPAAPTSLAASATSSSEIDLSWTNNATNASAYEVDRSPDGIAWSVLTTALSSTATSYQDTGLSPMTTYYYRVQAINAGGASGYSNVAGATTLPVPPTAPTGLSAAAVSTNAIDLTWTDTATNADNYTVERSPDGNTWSVITSTVPGTATSYQDTGLAGATTYSYRVKATNAGGSSAYSNTATATTATLYASDSFSRTVSGAWGTPDFTDTAGLSWQLTFGSASAFAVGPDFAGSTGAGKQIATAAGQTRQMTLALNHQNVSATVRVALDQVPVGGNLNAYVYLRYVNDFNWYRLGVALTPAKSIWLNLAKRTGTATSYTDTTLASQTISGLTYAAKTYYRLRFETESTSATATTLRGKIWPDGTTEPASFQVSASGDTTASLQTAGSLALRSYTASSYTGTLPVTYYWDDLSATTLFSP